MSEGFVYRWTHKVTGKWYIGSHKGKPSDKYIGSGKSFLLAVKKHGIESFDREILYEGRDFREVETKALISLNAVKNRQSYNLKNIGQGGFAPEYFGENNGAATLTNEKVLKIYTSLGCQRCLGKEYGVSFRIISSIKTGRTWSRITKHDKENSFDHRKGRTRICKKH